MCRVGKVLRLLSTAPAPSASDRSFCSDATYKRNSTCMSNLRTLAAALIGDAARLHSATGAAGEGPDRVYGAALCRADSAGADCGRRLRDALVGAMDGGSTTGDASCALRRDVAVYSELYQLRFSDRDFLADFSNAPEWADVTNPGAVATRFDERVAELLTALADAAARRPDRWAVGEARGRRCRRGRRTGRCTGWRSARGTCRLTAAGLALAAASRSGGGRSAAARWVGRSSGRGAPCGTRWTCSSECCQFVMLVTKMSYFCKLRKFSLI